MPSAQLTIKPLRMHRGKNKCFSQPRYSVRIIRPFIRLLRRHEGFLPRVLDNVEQFDLEDRISIASFHELIETAVAFTGDADLGLKAAREISPGDLGVLDYAMSTAATVRESIETAVTYQSVVDEAIDFKLEGRGDRAVIRAENRVTIPRTALDYLLGVFYRNHFIRWPRVTSSGHQVWFSYPRPDNVVEYYITFPLAKIRFSAPFTGFSFMKDDLDAPLQSADRYLHGVMQRHAKIMLLEISDGSSVTERVRERIMSDLSNGGCYTKRISQELHMSSRTLIRKLESEGTTFTELLDDVRRRLALTYVGDKNIDYCDIAALLGFSHLSAFHRAFKRWTGETPAKYRRSQNKRESGSVELNRSRSEIRVLSI
jgi:AraC-like DNA-binding protein